jgi:hypothetical protein
MDFRTNKLTFKKVDMFTHKGEASFKKDVSPKDEWKDEWTDQEAAVFVIPLNVGRRKIQSLFAKQLAKILNSALPTIAQVYICARSCATVQLASCTQ